MHHLANSMTELCHGGEHMTILMGKAFQCTAVLGKKLYLQFLVEVLICLYTSGWMNLDCLRFGVR